MAQLDRLGWAGHHTYQLGRTYLGVRASQSGYSDVLAKALAAHLQPEANSPANFSVILPRQDGSAIGLGALHHGHRQILRTSDLARLTRGLLSHLGSYIRVPDLLTVRRTVAIRDGAAALVPQSVSTLPQSLIANLERQGIFVHDAARVELDIHRREAVIPELALALDEHQIAEFVNGHVLPTVGKFALVGMVEEVSGPAKPSMLFRVARLLQGSINLEMMGVEDVVDRLLELYKETPAYPFNGRGREFAEAVALALR